MIGLLLGLFFFFFNVQCDKNILKMEHEIHPPIQLCVFWLLTAKSFSSFDNCRDLKFGLAF